MKGVHLCGGRGTYPLFTWSVMYLDLKSKWPNQPWRKEFLLVAMWKSQKGDGQQKIKLEKNTYFNENQSLEKPVSRFTQIDFLPWNFFFLRSI